MFLMSREHGTTMDHDYSFLKIKIVQNLRSPVFLCIMLWFLTQTATFTQVGRHIVLFSSLDTYVQSKHK